LIGLTCGKRPEHHAEGSNKDRLAILDAIFFLELGACPIEQSENSILDKLGESKPEANTISLFDILNHRNFN
jgi:hypothetical protein